MPHGKTLTELEICKIYQLKGAGQSLRRISAAVNQSTCAVRNVLTLDENYDRNKRCGRPKLHTPRNERKSVADKEKKALRVAQRVQRQQELKRLRTAQEIHRHLQELEVQQRELERRGVEVEKALRGESEGSLRRIRGETELMQEWFNLVHAKNKLVQKEQELLIRAKDVELEERHSRLQQEMRQRMTESGVQKSKTEIEEEGKILAEMLEIVEKRDELVSMIDQLRIREEEEDRDLESKMLANGLQFSPTDKS
ncbi:F-actin-monooxygenase MICAL3-like [Centruroides sculpturatus]|uniref:F-actin-monooxygenase MICAL3-like n=1 Tax=Centruroides sculpturatus TaxID=218467 RepID=UPI000C6D7019|nr:F-actin-monooxygenase MICAL3-like [Centruroides sculpturatus]